eukprot:5682512-Amphidinium_carterae.2
MSTDQKAPPKLPAASPQTFTLNAVVGADLFNMVHPISGQTEHWLHVIDWGTGFQQSERVRTMRTKEASHVFMIYGEILRKDLGAILWTSFYSCGGCWS